MNPNESTVTRLDTALDGHGFHHLDSCDGIATLRCDMQNAREILKALRDDAGFEIATMITAVDHADADDSQEARFDVIWQFQSVEHNDRVRLHAWAAGEEPGTAEFSAPSIMELWPAAAYYERECYDMFGIQFDGHEGLKRILMPEAYEHFPLRKEFPHGGIEPDKLYKAWDKSRREPAGDPS